MPGWGSIISAAVQGAVSALLGPLVRWFQDRALVQQGKNEQTQADLAATVKGDADARRIEANDVDLDRDALLAKLHDQSTGSR